MEKDILKKKIVDCELSVRAINCLMSAGIETVGDLCQKDPKEIRKIRNLGGRTFWELDDFLEDNGLGWGTDVKDEEPFGGTEIHSEVERWVIENCAKRYDFHHRLLAMGLSQKQAVTVMYAISIMLGIFAYLMIGKTRNVKIVCLVVAFEKAHDGYGRQ